MSSEVFLNVVGGSRISKQSHKMSEAEKLAREYVNRNRGKTVNLISVKTGLVVKRIP